MPTYEYKCDACGATFELEQRITEKPVKKCSNCGRARAHRLISTSAPPILKGGGWYADLYSSRAPSQKKSGEDKGDKSESSDKVDKPSTDKASTDKPGTDKPSTDKPKADSSVKSEGSTKAEKKAAKKSD